MPATRGDSQEEPKSFANRSGAFLPRVSDSLRGSTRRIAALENQARRPSFLLAKAVVLALGVVLCVPSALAQTGPYVELELEAPFSLAWTVSSAGNAVQRSEGGGRVTISAKNVPLRAITADIIYPLVRDGVIPGPAKGWKLVARATSSEAYLGNYRIYAVKSGHADQELLNSQDTKALDLALWGGRFSVVEKYQRAEFTEASYDGQVYFRGMFWLSPIDFGISGLARMPIKYQPVRVGLTRGFPPLPGVVTYQVQAGGVVESGPREGEFMTATGTIKIGPHRVLRSFVVTP